ncbi:CBS domain-containing protein [bacterium]|nr:CBS domain-containing protein [bacterium]MBU1935975.1 CBS domain-containing protein [bacterium]
MKNTAFREEFIYLSRIIGRRARSRELKTPMGSVYDVVATVGEMYPRLRGIILHHRNTYAFYPADRNDYVELATRKRLTVDERRIKHVEWNPNDISLRDLLWDKQIVDVEGAKVERVNDVHLLISDHQWLVHVDVGYKGLLRRLGWLQPIQTLCSLLRIPLKDELISWKFVQPVSSEGDLGPVRLKVSSDNMKQLHPGELADILEELDKLERQAILDAIDDETAAEALEETNEETVRAIFENLSTERAADILEEMEPSKAADVLSALSGDISSEIIEEIEQEAKEELQELIAYPEKTAGAMMTTDFLEIDSDVTVAEALAEITRAADEVEALYYAYVHDSEGCLKGAISLRHLLGAKPEEKVGEILQPRLVSIQLDTPSSEIAELFLRYSFLALPVVDEENHMKGIVSLKHAFDELMPYLYRQWKADI